jgi:pSer/pThr/pTyr-binding forkhead associated (FHA) protein
VRIRYRLNGVSMVSRPTQGQAVIGRVPEADVFIPDDAHVSSRHATIAVLPDGTYRLTDHSSNGTWVNGARITSAVVPAGAEFRVGSTLVCIDGQV